MIAKLVERIFKARNEAHVQHWTTSSYAEHKTLGEYYEDVIEKLDDLVEAHQGTFGLIKELPDQTESMIKVLNEEMLWLNENREKIANNIPALENIIDELTGLHAKTLYKLENLR